MFRLVALGYTMRKAVKYTDVIAPTVRLVTLLILVVLDAKENLEIHHTDVSTAFLNGEMDEEVFTQQPEGTVKSREEHLVCRLRKTLYGTKQAVTQGQGNWRDAERFELQSDFIQEWFVLLWQRR